MATTLLMLTSVLLSYRCHNCRVGNNNNYIYTFNALKTLDTVILFILTTCLQDVSNILTVHSDTASIGKQV